MLSPSLDSPRSMIPTPASSHETQKHPQASPSAPGAETQSLKVILVHLLQSLIASVSAVAEMTLYSPTRSCCSVAKSCPTLSDAMDCRAPGLPVPHCLPELAQFMPIESVMPSNHVILCHLLLLPSGSESVPGSWFFESGGQNVGWSRSFLPVNSQGWFPLGLMAKGLSRVFSSTTVRKHQFFSAQPSLWSNF